MDSYRMLYAEPDVLRQNKLKTELKELGYPTDNFRSVLDYNEFEDTVLLNDYDLIFTGDDAVVEISRIRKFNPKTPIIMIADAPKITDIAVEAGASAVITMNYSEAQLDTVIMKLLDRRVELNSQIYSFEKVGPGFNKVRDPPASGEYMGTYILNDYFVATDGTLVHSPNIKRHDEMGAIGFIGDRVHNIMTSVHGNVQMYQVTKEKSDLETARAALSNLGLAAEELITPKGPFKVELEKYTLEHFNRETLTEFLERVGHVDVADPKSVRAFASYCSAFCREANRGIVPWNFLDTDPGEKQKVWIEVKRYEMFLRQLKGEI